jgi:hypothetical protein
MQINRFASGMKENKVSFTTETVFPLLVAGLSLFHLFNHLSDLLSLSALLSLIGITGTILYFKKNDLFKKLIYTWIIAQLIVIDRQLLDPSTQTWHDQPFWDLTQAVSFKLGLTLGTTSTKFGLNVNIVAIVFFGLYKILEVSSLMGKPVTFRKFRPDNKLGDVFPLTGTLKKRVILAKEKDWLLVELSSTFTFNGKPVDHVLIKRKDGEIIKPKLKNQIVFFRLVYNVNQVVEGENETSHFPFIDWVICE